jgi:outer membrane protein
MKKIHLLLVAFVALAVPSWAELKVAVFDTNAVVAGANASKRAATTMEARVNAARGQIDALEKPLKEKQQTLRQQASIMTPEKAREAQAVFAKEFAAFRQQAETIQGGLERENMQQRQRISEGLRSAVTQLAQEKGFDLVLPKGMVFFSSTAVPDVTAEVLARTNTILDK